MAFSGRRWGPPPTPMRRLGPAAAAPAAAGHAAAGPGLRRRRFPPEVAATGAQLLARATAARHPPILARLPDGSFLSALGALQVRVIDSPVDVVATLADGTRFHAERYLLLTTLTDARTDPAAVLVGLYHERWEVEVALHGLRQGLLGGRNLRSMDPPSASSRRCGHCCALHQLLRTAMVNATDTVKQAPDPDRASFTCAVKRPPATRSPSWPPESSPPPVPTDQPGPGRGDRSRVYWPNKLNPPRRPRTCARKLKSGRSRYASLPPGEYGDRRPAPRITGIAIAICTPPVDLKPRPDPPRTEHPASSPPARPAHPPPAHHRHHHQPPAPRLERPRTRPDARRQTPQHAHPAPRMGPLALPFSPAPATTPARLNTPTPNRVILDIQQPTLNYAALLRGRAAARSLTCPAARHEHGSYRETGGASHARPKRSGLT